MVWVVVAGVLVVAALAGIFVAGATMPRRARQHFREQRDRLYADFFAAASNSGKPRGLRWKGLDWTLEGVLPEPTLARDRHTGEIVALVPVTIRFEAVTGSDMEGLPAVGNLRNASAVFFYRRRRWQTSGRAVFNLNPDEALVHFRDQYSPLAQPEPRATGTQ